MIVYKCKSDETIIYRGSRHITVCNGKTHWRIDRWNRRIKDSACRCTPNRKEDAPTLFTDSEMTRREFFRAISVGPALAVIRMCANLTKNCESDNLR